jgi:glycosyltransferase involved in cell wall biosynthesis
MREGLKPFCRTPGEFGEQIIRVAFAPHNFSVPQKMLDQLFVSLQTIVLALPRAKGPFDVVITTIPAITSLLPGIVASAVFRAPHVVEMRDAWPDLVTYTPGLATKTGPLASVRRLVHRFVTSSQLNASQVITTTREFAAILSARGVREVSVVRNGTDLAEIDPLPAPTMDRKGLRVLYLGTMGRSQGLGTVIDAASLAEEAGANIEVRFVGEGVAKDALREKAEAVTADVTFWDSVPRDEVESHYLWADTIVVSLNGWGPFEWTVPSKVYEVLATNRHISALLAGEAASIVEQSGAGYVCPPGDARALANHWIELAQDRSLLDHGGAGRAWVDAHANYEDLSAEYLSVLERVREKAL